MSTPTLYRLLTWLSPAYPVGAFSYSQGLEAAVTEGLVTNADATRAWIEDGLTCGMLWSDAVIFARAHEATCGEDWATLDDIAAFAAAFLVTAELRLEAMSLGAAFRTTTEAAWPCPALAQLPSSVAYPVAVAAAAAGHGIAVAPALAAYLHAACASLVFAAVRLVPLGQTDGQRITAALEPSVHDALERAIATPLDRLSTLAFTAEICSMNHEIQHTRLFRS
ncbi:MAG: urease accessory UreF family protein [Hyphomicrobiales bacterium]